MGYARDTVRRRRVAGTPPRTDRAPARALARVAGDGATVLLLGLEDLGDDCWSVLAAAGVELVRVRDVAPRFSR